MADKKHHKLTNSHLELVPWQDILSLLTSVFNENKDMPFFKSHHMQREKF